MPNIQPYKINPITQASPIEYLTDTQTNALTLAFQSYYDNSSKKAQIQKDLDHSPILRHTRAIELLRAGVPVK